MRKHQSAFPLIGAPEAFPHQGGPRAFTLVELIVVVTILALLSTIGFVSYSSYLSGVRDTNRLSQLVAISDGLELYRTKKTLPIPDDNIEIRANGTVIGFQGYAGINVLETIDYSKTGKDPKDKTYFSYYLTQDKKYYQLLTYLEEEENLETNSNLFQKTHADTDYTNRYPKVSGKKLGILTQSGTNIPVQEVTELVSSGYLDIAITTDSYVARLTDDKNVSGTGIKLSLIENLNTIGGTISKSCKTLLDKHDTLRSKDGKYLIDPTGINPISTYCDMTKDGGGWTLYTAKAKHDYPNSGYFQIDSNKNNIDFEYVRWNYVSPLGKELPLIYKVYNKSEGELLVMHEENQGPITIEWTNTLIHYSNSTDFANAFTFGEENTSGIALLNYRNAIISDGQTKIYGRNGTSTPQLSHHLRGTAWYYNNLANDILRFPSCPYNGTWMIGSESFTHYSLNTDWSDGRSISIWIK